jgi:hypothetical protein
MSINRFPRKLLDAPSEVRLKYFINLRSYAVEENVVEEGRESAQVF